MIYGASRVMEDVSLLLFNGDRLEITVTLSYFLLLFFYRIVISFLLLILGYYWQF